jgi:hypothetical protein
MELTTQVNNSRQSNPWEQSSAVTQSAWEKTRVQTSVASASGVTERVKTGSAFVRASSQGATQERNLYLSDIAKTRKASAQVSQEVARKNGETSAALATILAQPAPAGFSRDLGNFIDRYA